MIQPQRALVRPRAFSPVSGQTLLLEDLVIDLAQAGQRRPIKIAGGPGSGKTTALKHLAAILTDRDSSSNEMGYEFLDEPRTKEEILLQAHKRQIVFTSEGILFDDQDWPKLQISPWDEDDLMEYLMGLHPERCGAILAALRQTDDGEKLEGIPKLWA